MQMEAGIQPQQPPGLDDVLCALQGALVLVLADVAGVVEAGPLGSQHQQLDLRRQLGELKGAYLEMSGECQLQPPTVANNRHIQAITVMAPPAVAPDLR